MIEYNKEIAQAIDTVFSESDWQRRYYLVRKLAHLTSRLSSQEK